jgi:RNA polymerase sigma-70 factor, ECF subfamily
MLTTEKLWNEMNGELKVFVHSKIKDQETVNDILQEVFIKVHTKNGVVRDKLKIKSWIYQIARNMVTDHFRKQRNVVNVDELKISDSGQENAEHKKFVACLVTHIDRLPLKYRDAIKEVELNGVKQNEYAKKLDVSYSGIKSRIQRARLLLRKEFEKCCKVSSDKYGNVVSYEPYDSCSC